MIASDPFLNQNAPLPPGVELQLSFERLKAEFSSLRLKKESEVLKNKILPLKNVFAEVEYISSPSLRNQMAAIESQPLKYSYDDLDVIYKTIPVFFRLIIFFLNFLFKMNEQSVRLENLRGGNTPDFVFIGIINTKALNGDADLGSSVFRNYDIQDFTLTLNGSACQGFPIRVSNNNPIWPFYKFYDVLGRNFNPIVSGQTKLEQFKDQLIFAHKFEGDENTQGWIGVSLTHSNPAGFTEQYSIGKRHVIDF